MTLVKDPLSPQEARAHIAGIRRDKGLIDGSATSANVSDLERALKM